MSKTERKTGVELAVQIREHLARDELILRVAGDRASRDQLVERGNQMARLLEQAADEIEQT